MNYLKSFIGALILLFIGYTKLLKNKVDKQKETIKNLKRNATIEKKVLEDEGKRAIFKQKQKLKVTKLKENEELLDKFEELKDVEDIKVFNDNFIASRV